MKTLIPAILAILLFLSNLSAAQEPSPSPPASPPAAPRSGEPSTANTGSSSSRTKNREIPSFLIVGTVFNEHALSFSGVQIRIRRSGEKKFLWETFTNSLGEFAVRVPPGYDYDVVAHVKKYEDQTQNVSSKSDVQQRMSIKMKPQGQTKTGGKS